MKNILTPLFFLLASATFAQPIVDVIRTEVPLWPKNVDDHYYLSLERKGREQFLKSMLTDVREGRTEVWSTGNVNVQLTAADIEKVFFRVDTQYVESPEPPNDMKMVVVKSELDYETVKSVRFYESWNMHAKTGRLERKILGICPVRNVYDITGQFRGTEPLYIIKYEDFKL